MKNKKGFTIIEVLLVVSLMTVVIITSIVSYKTISDKEIEKNYVVMVENIKTASELYLQKESSYKDTLNNVGDIMLPIRLLIEENYLSNYYTINPKTKESIEPKCIGVNLGIYKELEFSDELSYCNNYLTFDPVTIEISVNENTISNLGNTIKSEIKKGIHVYDSEMIEIDNKDVKYPEKAYNTSLKKSVEFNNVKNDISLTSTSVYMYTLSYEFEEKTYTRGLYITYTKTEVQVPDPVDPVVPDTPVDPVVPDTPVDPVIPPVPDPVYNLAFSPNIIVAYTSPSVPIDPETINAKIKSGITVTKDGTKVAIDSSLITYPSVKAMGASPSRSYTLTYKYNGKAFTRTLQIIYIPDVTYTANSTHTFPANGKYNITIYGAQGMGPSNTGGKGGMISGTMTASANVVITIVTGKRQTTSNNGGGASPLYYGGGGTYVKKSGTIILAAGGGGGGATGTNGSSSGTGAGGICGTPNYGAECTNGSNGSTLGTNVIVGGGGSSGYYYPTCKTFKKVHNPCASTTKKCTTKYHKGTCKCTGFHNPADDECHGGEVVCGADVPYDDCTETCVGAWENSDDCAVLGAAKYTSGQGGHNYYSGVFSGISNSTGNTGNGKAIIKYVGN